MGIMLSIALLTILLLYIAILIGIMSIYQQLQEYNNGQKRKKIRIATIFKPLTKLAAEINRCIKNREQADITAFQHEKRLKESITDMSHDLRTPLTVLQGYLEMIDPAAEPETMRVYLGAMKHKTSQLNDIINSFYDLSVFESDGYVLCMEPFDLTELLTECILDHASLFRRESIEPHIILPHKPFMVNLDKQACRRIIENLLTNARSYADGEIEIQLFADHEFYILDISNQTERISSSDMQYLFNRFYQQDKSRQGNGSGLGLYIVKLLLEKMGIRVEVSLKNSWITFRVFFTEFNEEQ